MPIVFLATDYILLGQYMCIYILSCDLGTSPHIGSCQRSIPPSQTLSTMEARQVTRRSAFALLISLIVFSIACSSASAAQEDQAMRNRHEDFSMLAQDIGLLINFSVPCDLNSAIAIPDAGGLLTPNLLAVGYQSYIYDGSKWVYVTQEAILLNKTLSRVGRLFGATDGQVTFEIGPQSRDTTVVATVTAKPTVSVYQMFSIPLQLLNVTGSANTSPYVAADYVQRFGTQFGLPPGPDFPAKAGDTFKSRFSAFYAFYLPIDLSPQLATRVPRCGDERFYGLQNRG